MPELINISITVLDDPNSPNRNIIFKVLLADIFIQKNVYTVVIEPENVLQNLLLWTEFVFQLMRSDLSTINKKFTFYCNSVKY